MAKEHKIRRIVSPHKIGVFISYNHADLPIAAALRECLIALSSDLDPFIDHVALKAGDEYEEKIAQSIGSSQWFVMICSGSPRPERDMGWCMYEAGQFRRKLLEEDKAALIRSRFIALHDEERPNQLAKYQSVKISAKDIQVQPQDLGTEASSSEGTVSIENTPIFSFLQSIIRDSRTNPLRDLTDENVRRLLRAHARLLTRAFVDAQSEGKLPEKVLQPRISFLLPPGAKTGRAKLTPDTQVVGYESSLSIIFSIAGTETTWGTIKARCKEKDNTDAVWISEIEAAAEEVSQDFVPEQPEGLCLAKADKKFYRVLFARYEPFRSGARTCYIVFIPCRFRGFDVKQRTSILLSALILSIRFRQRVLPFIELIQALQKKDALDSLLRLERELHGVETEAQEFGLSGIKGDEDDPPLLRQFRDGDNKLFVQECIRSWGTGRRALADAIHRARSSDRAVTQTDSAVNMTDIVITELQKVQKVNGRFIQLVAEELLFVEKVSAEE